MRETDILLLLLREILTDINFFFFLAEYIEAQTILIDHNEIAQYWISMDYIMYLRRIDINELDEPSIETPTF